MDTQSNVQAYPGEDRYLSPYAELLTFLGIYGLANSPKLPHTFSMLLPADVPMRPYSEVFVDPLHVLLIALITPRTHPVPSKRVANVALPLSEVR